MRYSKSIKKHCDVDLNVINNNVVSLLKGEPFKIFINGNVLSVSKGGWIKFLSKEEKGGKGVKVLLERDFSALEKHYLKCNGFKVVKNTISLV